MNIVGVMGGHAATPETLQLASRLGAAIAARNWVLLTGGRDEGIMTAATQGSKEAGGLSLAIHPGEPGDPCVAPADVVVFTGMGWARNHINIISSHAIIALPGAAGTLSEVAYADVHGIPTALLGFDDRDWFEDRVARVNTVDEAIAWLAKCFEARPS